MSLGNEFTTRNRTLAQRFLQTAVVVDDEARMTLNGDDGPPAEVVTPSRNSRTSHQDEQSLAGRKASHALDAGSLIGSFSELGIICGAIGPTDTAMETMRQADILILDWRLQEDDPDRALNLLRDLLTEEADLNSLRLVAIYTAEKGLESIGEKVYAELHNWGLEPEKNETKAEIGYRHGRIVLYAKSGVHLVSQLKDRSVTEKNLPSRLVDDFASMTAGLLPGIALTSLAAVREGAHRVLDQFGAELDPAFLAHMACLSSPEEAERQIVAHVADELRGLADEAVAAVSPAGKQAAEHWIRNDGRDRFEFGGKPLELAQTIQLVTEGLDAISEFSKTFKKKAFEVLSAGFAQPGALGLDERLAWIMSFRTVYSAPAPTLWQGSVVTMQQDGNEMHLLCMRPRCDCLRLNEETVFFFLPLVDPKAEMDQIVVCIDDTFKRLGIERDPSRWILRRFKPSAGIGAVTAEEQNLNGSFEFKDSCDVRYAWQGELKAEYAQRIAQNFAEKLSRVPVDESEWLRGMAKKK